MAQKLPKLLADPMRVMRLGGNGPVTKFICGYFGFDREAGRLFLTGLPKLVKIGMRGDARLSWLETTIGYAIKEVQNHRPGSLALLSKTSEALFIEALSRYMDTMSPDARGWLAAVRDPIVGVALGELHKEPAYPWNVGELARRAGASRTMLSKRFHHLLGQTPMNYLATWRLQLGAQYLKTSRRTVIQVAADVGYESEAAFNRAFKREFGKPPANYRRSHAQRGQSVANP